MVLSLWPWTFNPKVYRCCPFQIFYLFIIKYSMKRELSRFEMFLNYNVSCNKDLVTDYQYQYMHDLDIWPWFAHDCHEYLGRRHAKIKLWPNKKNCSHCEMNYKGDFELSPLTTNPYHIRLAILWRCVVGICWGNFCGVLSVGAAGQGRWNCRCCCCYCHWDDLRHDYWPPAGCSEYCCWSYCSWYTRMLACKNLKVIFKYCKLSLYLSFYFREYRSRHGFSVFYIRETIILVNIAKIKGSWIKDGLHLMKHLCAMSEQQTRHVTKTLIIKWFDMILLFKICTNASTPVT